MPPSTSLDPAQVLTYRDAAIGQMQFARTYLLGLVENITPDEWLTIPPNGSSHLLWQIGHIAVAQYGLMLFRQRGRAEGDVELMPGWLRKNFGRGTSASIEADYNPTPEVMLAMLDRIHERSMAEASQLSVEVLTEPADMPYAVFPMKLGALLFAPMHESIHIGQIGVLRRMLGKAPVR